MIATRFPGLFALLTGANGSRKAQKTIRRATLAGLAAAVGRPLPEVLR